MQIDDTWSREALDIIKDINANVLITSLNRSYSYDECREFDLIASCTTGVDHIESRDIPLISLKGETGFLQDVHATAEMTIALMLALIRKIPFAFESVKQGNWNRDAFQGSELFGKKLGIVGYGRVGQQVAKIAEAFGMKVICHEPIGETDISNMNFGYLLKNSDIITVHVPLNDETRGMFGIEQFKLMKPTSYFINTSRGAIVNEDALIEALDEKYIAGAALDVVADETKWNRYDSELLCQIDNFDEPDNLIITPHIGGCTQESRMKTQILIANRIKEYINSKGE